jgi:hypothetical protein
LGDEWGELDAVQHQIDVAYRAGEMVTMRRLLDDMRALGAALDHPDIRPIIGCNQMRLAVYQGDWMTVLHLAQELIALQQTRFDPSVAWLSLANLGLAYMKLGAYAQAYTVAQQAVAASEEAHVLGLRTRSARPTGADRGSLDEARVILLDLLETPDPLIGATEAVSPTLVLVRCMWLRALPRKPNAGQACLGSRERGPSAGPVPAVAGSWAMVRLPPGVLTKRVSVSSTRLNSFPCSKTRHPRRFLCCGGGSAAG